MEFCRNLKQKDIENIHATSLRILEEIGMVFTYGPAKEMFKKHGARVDGDRVYLSRDLVENALKTTPSSFELTCRAPEKNVIINTTDTVFCGPGGPPYVQDFDRGRRVSTEEDLISAMKLLHDLPYIQVPCTLACEPYGVDEKLRPNIIMYDALKYTDKPLFACCDGYESAKQCIEMAAIAQGGLDCIEKRHVLISIPCSITPLLWDDRQCGALMAYAELNQPMLICSLGNAGVTSPVTFAGTLALQNAEILAGITLTQMVRPGCPVVYAGSSSNADMSTGSLCIGSPEFAMYSMYNSQIAKYYNLPCRNSGNISDSKTMDSQAAFESTIVGMMSVLTGGNFIFHAAGILDSYSCLSFEKMMIDNEILGYFRQLTKEVIVDEETLAYDTIKEVGACGTYLLTDLTLENFRDTFYFPKLSYRKSFAQWTEDGQQTMEQRANAQWKKMLAEYQEPVLPRDVDAALRKYIAR